MTGTGREGMATIAADQTAEILAMYGTPEKRRDYAIMTARRVYDQQREAAKDAFRAAVPAAAGHQHVTAFAVPGHPATTVLLAAIEQAAGEYQQARREAWAAWRAETGTPLAHGERSECTCECGFTGLTRAVLRHHLDNPGTYP